MKKYIKSYSAVKAISAKKAKEISDRTGMALCGADDGKTFYATNEEEDGVWLFDTKKERDAFIARHNK